MDRSAPITQMTVYQLFVAMAMASLLSSPRDLSMDQVGDAAVRAADAAMKALESRTEE